MSVVGSSIFFTLFVDNSPPPAPPVPTSPFGVSELRGPQRTTPTLQNFASRQLVAPFQVGNGGSVLTTTSLSVVAAQEIRSIIATIPGERFMRPGYGSAAHGLIFEPIQDDLDAIAEQIRDALVAQAQNAQVQSVNCNHDPLAPTQISVTVQFSVAPFQTVETAIVSMTAA